MIQILCNYRRYYGFIIINNKINKKFKMNMKFVQKKKKCQQKIESVE